MFPFLFFLKLAVLAAFSAAVGLILLFILSVIAGHYQRSGDRRLHRLTQGFMVLVLLPFLLLPVLGLYAYFIEPDWIQVKTVKVYSPDFPAGLSQIKIVQLSDLHIEEIGRREKRLIAIVNRIKPDVILLTGDYVNGADGWEKSLWVIKELKAAYGTYAILGNTDYYFASEEKMLEWFGQIGVRVLLSESQELDFGPWGKLRLVGLSEMYGARAYYNQETHLVDEAFAGIPENSPKILLIHSPEYARMEKIAAYHPQLILAGDTHGGQISFPFLRQFSDYADSLKHIAGMFLINDMPLYVNRGIGMKTLKARFLCRPEVTVIQLEMGTSERSTLFELGIKKNYD